MKKWQKKINRRVSHYDKGWDAEMEERERLGAPLMCRRAYRREGFRDGAEWMLEEVLHLLRQRKYKCDKMIREGVTTAEKRVPIFVASLYSRIIKELKD